MDDTLEPCFNVWIFIDPLTGIAQSLAAKAYALSGGDKDKLALLRSLAPTDFYAARREPVPARHVLQAPHGQHIPGALHVSQIEAAALELDAIATVTPLPVQMVVPGGVPEGFVLPVPESPLAVVTVVEERRDGTLVPVV